MKTNQECYDEVWTLMFNMMIDNVYLIKMPLIQLTSKQKDQLSCIPSFIPGAISEYQAEDLILEEE